MFLKDGSFHVCIYLYVSLRIIPFERLYVYMFVQLGRYVYVSPCPYDKGIRSDERHKRGSFFFEVGGKYQSEEGNVCNIILLDP